VTVGLLATTRLRARFPPVYRTPEPHHSYERAPIHRLNAFSKKVENHEAAIALHYMYYNFASVHQSLRVTPAMEAGISVHFWTLQEIVALL
jgi:hypothetical protein